MKIRVERDALADAVAWVARSLPNRPTAPILAGLLMNASGDEVTLSSFDSTTSAQVTMPAEVTDEGTVLVSGRLLNEIARSLPNKPVEMVSDHTQVELICGSARFSLQTLPVEEYPTLPEMPTQTGLVDASVFEKSVSQVVIAAGRDELLNVFTGVRVEINGDRLSLLATDRYRMALKELTWQPSSPDIEGAVLVPGRVLADTAKSLTSGKTVTVSLSTTESEGEGLVGFTGEGAKSRRDATTRLLNQAFPKVRHLMDVVGTVTVRVPTADLLAAVKRVSLVAERNTPLRMLIEDDHISLEAATGDQAHASEAIEAQVGVVGEEKSIEAAGFNPHYLLDALGALDAPYAHFSFTAPGKPCLITGLATIDGDQLFDYRHVIMLMRLPS
ncbi:DNA polymerase III subunit beta [Arachnia propionica]|uniref:Beta sliding clamp n=1 Tax=Arachnia propionica TaxID=1750 RepID=A0AB37HUM8_9ACTN|nr:DNA polymerase III subunit beta [Arachnia propionica]AFN46133.1 DNA polymerase III, beta subunit [Arachnia propionica F0230a]QCT36534.1 DNA polymerase III subunit beta [Arachnia propionica]QUC11151.1 DNA polymerase III subunit beta [Arachnia propionica]RPA18007.1 DNA polymerase III subunit beta [Arachnia propionica]